MEQKVYTADDLDLIENQELVETYGINHGRRMILLDSGQLSAYERIPRKVESVLPSMEPERYEKLARKKWEEIPDNKEPFPGVPDSRNFPEEGLDPIPHAQAEYRPLTSNEVAGLTPENADLLYYSRAEVELLTGEETESEMSYVDMEKRRLRLLVTKMAKAGKIKSKDDLFRNYAINSFMKDPELNWAPETIIKYTQGCGIPEKKRGRKPTK